MKALSTLFLICLGSYGWSQDYHHWSEHFGARASLLGGAATAGLGDNATTYYNAAAMAFVEHPSISISVSAYRIRMLKLENALGEGLDLKESSFSTMPNLIAGITTFEKHPKIRLGYAILTRRSFNSKFDYLGETNEELLSQFAGLERRVSAYNLHHSLMEYSAGFGISYQVSKGFAIGLSHFGIYRDVKYVRSYSVSILPQDFSGLEVYEVSNVHSFNYYNVKGVFKPSIALSVENFKFGLAFTTPSFNMFGKAKAYRRISYINLKDILPTIDYDVQVVDRVEDIKVMHKEFGSLAIGVSWKLGKKSWLHVTNETYFGGKEYYIFNSDEKPSVFPDAFTDDQLEDGLLGGQNFLSLTEQTEARTNMGIGFEGPIAKTWDIYLGARTDFLYNENNVNRYESETIQIEASLWNLYHFSIGFVHLTKKNKRYTVGLEYGMAGLNTNKKSVGNSRSDSFKLLLEIEIGKPPVTE